MTNTLDDIDTLYLETETIKKLSKSKPIKVRSARDKAKSQYRAAKRLHRSAIKSSKADIRKHRLLLRQAHNVYKLSCLDK